MAAPWQVTGTADIAPHSPVADWRCVTEGEGYGNYYDPISQQYATVTRATPKTARTADGRIVDVPAGKLALEPWSLHKEDGVGYAAIIEEARTNYLLNSYFAADTNGDGLADSVEWYGTIGTGGSLVATLSDSARYGKMQRVSLVGGALCSINPGIKLSNTAVGTFAAGQAACASIHIEELDTVGCSLGITLSVRNEAGSQVGSVLVPITGVGLVSAAYQTLPAGTSRCSIEITARGDFSPGDTMTLGISAVQLEKGAFATSYIPTTTAAVTRAADMVSVPTTRWNSTAGTVSMVLGSALNVPSRGGTALLWYGAALASDAIAVIHDTSRLTNLLTRSAAGTTAMTSGVTPEPRIPMAGSFTWSDGARLRGNVNGTALTQSATNYAIPVGLGTVAHLARGSNWQQMFNGPIARLTVYDTALTDEQLAAADMTTDLLAGIEGVAAPALAADWRVVPTGLGYGNYYDSVTKQWATVTRTTPKTAQIAPDRIVDVPAGQLAVVPWSMHKEGGLGYAAVIEEARTNYLTNSYFSADTNADGLPDSFLSWANSLPAISHSRVVAAAYKDYAAQAAVVGAGAGSNGIFWYQNSAVGTFAAGESATGSVYVQGSRSGSAYFLVVLTAYDAGGTNLGSAASSAIVPASGMVRATCTYATLPATTSYIRLNLYGYGGASGGDLTVRAECAQLEKGSFATSYIPTTTAAVTRNADVVTVPTVGWNAAEVTMVGVVGNALPTTQSNWLGWGASGSQAISIYESRTSMVALANTVAGGVVYDTKAYTLAANVHAARFSSGDAIRSVVNGGGGVRTDAYTTILTPPATAVIGAQFTGTSTPYNGPIARVTVYASALTDAQIASAELTTELLKGLDTSKLTKEMILDETRTDFSAIYISR